MAGYIARAHGVSNGCYLWQRCPLHPPRPCGQHRRVMRLATRRPQRVAKPLQIVSKVDEKLSAALGSRTEIEERRSPGPSVVKIHVQGSTASALRQPEFPPP